METQNKIHKPIKIGDVIDERYQVVSLLGRGGFSVVFKALQLSTGQYVALKLLRPAKLAKNTKIEVARFEREMKMIGKLKHPNIVRLIDTGRLEGERHYMVLEYIEGEDLSDLLARDGAIPIREVKRLMGQVMDALCSAHKLGIVHRDLKPQNLMLTRMGYRLNAMVLDFGIAAVMANSRQPDYKTLTQGYRIHGTPSYMAPEQLREKTNPTLKSDIYAWGLVFIECLTGQRVVLGETPLDIALQQASPDPVGIPAFVDDALSHILERSLVKSLEGRYSSAEEVLIDLDAHDNMLTLKGDAVGRYGLPSSKLIKPSHPRGLRRGLQESTLKAARSEIKFPGLQQMSGFKDASVHASLPSLRFDLNSPGVPTYDKISAIEEPPSKSLDDLKAQRFSGEGSRVDSVVPRESNVAGEAPESEDNNGEAQGVDDEVSEALAVGGEAALTVSDGDSPQGVQPINVRTRFDKTRSNLLLSLAVAFVLIMILTLWWWSGQS